MPLYQLEAKRKIEDDTVSCVYKIWFGKKYYVGRTNNLAVRMRSHQSVINEKGRFWESAKNKNHYCRKILDHICENDLFWGYYEVVQICKNEMELVYWEQYYLDLGKEDDNCLNVGFVAKSYDPDYVKVQEKEVDEFQIEKCIYKLYHGDRYIIVKGKNLAGSVFLIDKGYAGFLAGNKLNLKGSGHKEWEGKNSFYFKFYRYKQKFPKLPTKTEVIFESEDGFELLKREQEELQKSIRDKKCLNSNVESYIPVFREKTQSFGWLTKAEVDKFNLYLQQPFPACQDNK